jgi:hypothetical protein
MERIRLESNLEGFLRNISVFLNVDGRDGGREEKKGGKCEFHCV